MAWLDLLDNLVHNSQGPADNPWPRCSFDEDFVIVAEFSELEGPRTVLTIPESGGGSFNKNSFAVRIMSVDCTSCQATSGDSKEEELGFTISGDTQVVMTEPSEGAAAYVHHFTLYDIHARGFVRPFCIAYITNTHSKIMNNFKCLISNFSKVSANFRFGNAMSFLQDLKLRFGFLENLKKVKAKMEADGSVENIFVDKHSKEIENINIDECMGDTRRLQYKFLAFLKSEMFLEQQERYSEYLRVFLNEHQDITAEVDNLAEGNTDEILTPDHVTHLKDVEVVEVDLASDTDSCDELFTNLSPHSVGITGGRKFDIYLRTIEELCHPVGKDALFMIENIYFVLRDCTGELNADEERLLDATEMDSEEDQIPSILRTGVKIMGSKGKLKVGSASPKPHVKVYRRSVSFPRENLTHPKADYRRRHSSSLHQWDPMFNLFDDDWSMKSSDSYEIIKHSQSSSDDANSVSSENTRNSSPKPARPGKVERLRFAPLDVEDGGQCPPQYPQLSVVSMPPIRCGSAPVGGKKSSDDNQTGLTTSRSAGHDVMTANRSSFESVRTMDRSSLGSAESKSKYELEFDHHVLQEKFSKYVARQVSSETVSSAESVLPLRRYAFRKFSNVLGPDSGYYFQDTSRFSLYKIRQIYSFLPHLIFSLLIGRPVIIHAEKANENQVRCLVKSLFPFIPGLHERHNGVIFWTKGPLHISLLHSMKLVGLTKARRIQRSIKPYVSILDFEACRLLSPPYKGKYLNSIFDANKEWPSEDTFIQYLKGVQRELSAYCFVNFCLMLQEEDKYIACDGTHLATNEGFGPSAWMRSVKMNHEKFFEGKLAPGDKLIVQHLTDVVKDQLVRSLKQYDGYQPGSCLYSEQYESAGQPMPPCIRLNKLRCQCFSLTKKKEK